MVWLGPVSGEVDEQGRSYVDVDPLLTDEDLDWVNRSLESAGLPVARRSVDITPDPRLSQIIKR